MGTLLSKVVIDGVTIWDNTTQPTNAYLINWEYERSGTNEISVLNMSVLASISNTITLSVGKTVEIWKGFTTSTDTKVFDGYISEFNPSGGLVDIVAKDKMWDLIRKNVNKVYEIAGPQAGVVSAIAEDLIETYGGLNSFVVATGTNDTETIDEFRCVHTDIFERLKALADAVRYQFWYDAINDTVHFEPMGYNSSGQTLTVGDNIIGLPVWNNDTSKMVNDLRVDGAVALTQIRKPQGTGYATIGTTTDFNTDSIILDKTPESVELILDTSTPPITVKTGGSKDSSVGNYYYIDKENKKVVPASGTSFPIENAIVNYQWNQPSPIHQINQGSIDEYGKFEQQRTLSDIITIADAEVRTAEILARFSQPFLIGNLKVKSDVSIDVNFGDTVVIVDDISSPSINKSLVVTKQLIKYPATNQELTVGDESIRLADWQFDVDNRLKRIEESLSLSNQDLILELIDIQNSFEYKPRYYQVLNRDVTDDSLWDKPGLVWDTAPFVWQDDYTEENELHFIKQYQNIYSEEFIDDDFKSTNTTATWIGGTFTSGQVLESSSIDYGNDTITQVKLTSTEVSGSFGYDVTADGVNWESTTSGVLHTFTNTGTDLRWRATENNTSTGEISMMVLKNYH